MQHGRLPWPSREELDDAQRALYDSITAGPRSASRAFPMVDEEGRLYGPFNAMLLEPVVGAVISELGVALRYRSVLPARMREIAICEVAAWCRSEFEWFAHASIARNLEVSEADLEAIRLGNECSGLSGEEQLARRLAHALVSRRDLDDADYDAAVDQLGLDHLADLVFLVGFYTTIATTLATFRVPLPAGVAEAFSTK
jgi:4-carboxymuconolactone decarboxylase